MPDTNRPTTEFCGCQTDGQTDDTSGTLDRIVPGLYAELRRLASQHLRQERRGHTLQTTALANEAYLKLAEQYGLSLSDRRLILSTASHLMRRILVDHARKRRAKKRGGIGAKVTMDAQLAPDQRKPSHIDLIDLDDAMNRLAALNERQARMVELRYFGGLTADETATELGISVATIHRDWQLARAWLYRELSTS